MSAAFGLILDLLTYGIKGHGARARFATNKRLHDRNSYGAGGLHADAFSERIDVLLLWFERNDRASFSETSEYRRTTESEISVVGPYIEHARHARQHLVEPRTYFMF